MANITYKKIEKKQIDVLEEFAEMRINELILQNAISDDCINKVIEANYSLKKSFNKRKAKEHISGYNLFVRELFPQIKLDNPNLGTVEMLKLCANAWKETDDETKQSYNIRAEKIPSRNATPKESNTPTKPQKGKGSGKNKNEKKDEKLEKAFIKRIENKEKAKTKTQDILLPSTDAKILLAKINQAKKDLKDNDKAVKELKKMNLNKNLEKTPYQKSMVS